MRRPLIASFRGWRPGVLTVLLSMLLMGALVMFGVPGTGAVFSADYPEGVTISAGHIFPADRITPAFDVSDHSSGTAADVSSPVAFAGDGRSTTTSNWPASFAFDRYVELHFNSPLPGNLALTQASFDLSWASVSGTVCMYLEVRDSNDVPQDVEGDAGSPLACTSSTSPGDLVTPLTGLTLTDAANGARVRLYIASSTTAGTVLDRTVLKVTYDAEQYTLQAIDLIDAADGTPSLDHWGLAGP